MWKKYKRQNYRGGKDGSYSRHLEADQSSSKAQTCLLGEGSWVQARAEGWVLWPVRVWVNQEPAHLDWVSVFFISDNVFGKA